jgi:hypothetical protein
MTTFLVNWAGATAGFFAFMLMADLALQTFETWLNNASRTQALAFAVLMCGGGGLIYAGARLL